MHKQRTAEQNKRKTYLGLNLLKILAATMIVFHHYQQVFKVRYSGINFYEGTFNVAYFVELFFIMSGFLTVHTSANFRWKSFVHKLLRIYPVALIACLFTLIVKTVHAEEIDSLWNCKTLVANVFLIFSGWPYFEMTGINNPTWYLCVLVQCYLVFYIINSIVPRIRINPIFVEAAVIIGAFVLYRYDLIAFSTYRGLQGFFVGACLYKLQRIMPKKKWVMAMTIAASLIVLIAVPSQQRRIVTFITFPIAVLLCTMWNEEFSPRIKVIVNLLGQMSFGVFVWHYPFMALENMIVRISGFEFCRTYFSMSVFTCAIWIIAYPLYRYVEQPINRLVKRYIM